ncbi:uncharacterized protein LOC122049439 [Zingiber officinale]|uniref:uncharacterized protein LOC122049439 n=1 Tax=Zingiber officinale TaxID=94328 RepID=UPI001C4CA1A5|nr:uncharacterized protein LOC122049439 [Zingiber officinale]
MADHDKSPREPPAVHRHGNPIRRRDVEQQQQDGAAEDLLTSLHDNLLSSVLSFLSIKQCVALSALCSDFRIRIPSLIPRVDAFRCYVGILSFDDALPLNRIFPIALLRQCRIVFHYVADSPKRLRHMLVDGLAETGVQDLIVESSHCGWLNLGGRDSGFLSIRSLRSLCLRRIRLWRRPSSSFSCPLLTSLRIENCLLRDSFLRLLLASYPFLETLQLIFCYGINRSIDKLSIHSASLKHLVLIYMIPSVRAIDVRGPKLESLLVDVVNELRIEAPKAQTASFHLAFLPPKDPSVALMNLFRTPFPRGLACLVLNSSRAPNGLAGINEFISPEYKEEGMIFNLDFNLKDESSTTILNDLLKKCNDYNTKIDIRADSTGTESSTETAREDQHLLHDSTGLELINLQMMMPESRFERFLSNRKKMKKFKHTGLEILRRRTSREQFMDTLASEEFLFQVSSTIANCIEMKF